jgi:polyphosphate glucokinase
VIGPWAEPISEWRRVAIAGATTDATPPELWPIVEEIGVEFDRISAGCDDCDRAILAGKLARESMRPARVAGVTELAVRSVIESRGIELVLAVGARFGAALFVDGVALPAFELGKHRFRKGQTYAEYLADADGLGRRKWNKRALRAIEQLLAVFEPRKLYVTGRDAILVHDEPVDRVEVVREDRALFGAIALWR